MKKYYFPLITCSIILSFYGCKKYLDISPKKSLVVPSSIQDAQSILDNNQFLNSSTDIGEAYTDYYDLDDNRFDTYFAPYTQNYYIFNPNIYGSGLGDNQTDWAKQYNVVYYANEALDVLKTIKPNANNLAAWNNAEGSALFYRGIAFFNIAQVFCKSYAKGTAATDLGIPLRIDPDFNPKSVRANVQQTYDQILTDLKSS